MQARDPEPGSSEARGLLRAAAAYTCWGLLSPGNEILLRQYTPMWMQAIRTGLATLVLLAWLGRPGLHRAAAVLRQPGILGALVLGTFASFALFTLAQTRIPATFTTLGFYTSPLWTAVLGRAVLGERVGWLFGPAAAGLLVGGYTALTGWGTLPPPDALGLGLAVASGLTWGAYAVLLRRRSARVAWPDLLLASTLLATPLFLVAAVASEPLPDLAAFTRTTWTWTLIQVAVPTLLSLALFQSALGHAPAGHVNLLVGLELAATVFFAWWLLDARFSLLQLGGLALVLLSVSGYLWQRTRPRAAAQLGSPV